MDKKEEKFLELLDGAVIQKHKSWDGYYFLFKNNVFLGRHSVYTKNLTFGQIWLTFQNDFRMSYQQTHDFLSDMLFKYLGWDVYKPTEEEWKTRFRNNKKMYGHLS